MGGIVSRAAAGPKAALGTQGILRACGVRARGVRDDARKSGVASTVVDCTGEGPVVLREGALTQADVRALS